MKLSSCLILVFALVAGCSAKPLVKSYGPAQAPRKEITPVPAATTPATYPPARSTADVAAAAVAVASPSSGPGYIVNCNGADHTLATCYEQADDLCKLQKNFVSSIVKIEESKSEGLIARSIVFRCNAALDYGRVGFPDDGSTIPGPKPSLKQELLFGK